MKPPQTSSDLAQRHATLSAKVEKENESREAAKQQAKGFSKSKQRRQPRSIEGGGEGGPRFPEAVHIDQKNLADLGRRIQDQQELSDIYANWIVLVESRERAALHHMIESLLWILLVLLAVYLANRLIERLFTGMTAENKRIDTLRAVTKFAAQAVGAVVIAFLIFGMPNQTTTVLGLAGAGLTVAMKDFIVAFFGWFVLMGRNGIRVGDWVEINGVAGEVIEVGLLKTVSARDRQLDRRGASHGPKSFVRQHLCDRRTLLQLHDLGTVDVGRTHDHDPERAGSLCRHRRTAETGDEGDRGKRAQGGRGVVALHDALPGAIVLCEARRQCAAERIGRRG